MSAATLLLLQLGPAIAGAVLALAFDAFNRRAFAVLCATLGLALSGGFALGLGTNSPGATAFDVLRVGGAFSTVPGLITILAAVTLWGGWRTFAERPGGGSAAALIALAAVASAAVAESLDLLMLLIALETAAAAGYALVADARTRRADESSIKYFIQGAIATGMLVMGLAVLVGGFVPSAAYGELASVFGEPSSPLALLAGVVLILTALAFKSSLVPFHSWAPDAYEAARPEVSSFLAAGPKLGALGAMALFALLLRSSPLAERVVVVLAVIAGLSILIGSLGALRQSSYTRMLGYAGIAQAGYAVIGVVVFEPAVAMFFAATYAIATTGTFLAASAFRDASPEWDGSIQGLAGMGRRAPSLALSLTFLLISLAGIPPLLGFWGKFQVFAGAVTLSARMFLVTGTPLLGWTYALLAVAGIVGSVVSLGYYGSVLQALYLAEEADAPTESADSSEAPEPVRGGSMTVSALVVLALAVLVLGLVPVFLGASSLIVPFAVS